MWHKKRGKTDGGRSAAYQPPQARRIPRWVWLVIAVSPVVVIAAASYWMSNLPKMPGDVEGVSSTNAAANRNGKELVDEAVIPVRFGRSWEEVDDPFHDGWDTELFSEQASEQLKKVGRWIPKGPPADVNEVALILAPEFSCGHLVPAHMKSVYRDRDLHVERGDPPGQSVNEQQFRGATGFVEALRELGSRFSDATDVRYKFKLFHIEQQADRIATRQYFVSRVKTESVVVAQHATWTIHWIPGASGDLPRIAWIGIDDFEQVSRSADQPLFAD